jgi:hypothetical protein
VNLDIDQAYGLLTKHRLTDYNIFELGEFLEEWINPIEEINCTTGSAVQSIHLISATMCILESGGSFGRIGLVSKNLDTDVSI